MKKCIQKIFLIVVFLYIAMAAFGEGNICLWVGQGTVYFKDLSGTICDKIIAGVTMEDFENESGNIGIDCFYNTEEGFKIGMRLASLNGGLKYKKFTTEKNSKKDVKLEGRYEASSIFMMYGGSYSKEISKKFSLNGKLFVGAAFVNFKSSQSISCEDKIVDNKELNEDQFCLASDLSLGIEWAFAKNWRLGFDVGYRFTPEIKMSEKENIKLDFSGAVYNLGVSYKI
jgi:outer membrane protein W